MGIDLIVFLGQKIYEPKGLGGLLVKARRPNSLKLESQIHEGGIRNNYFFSLLLNLKSLA
ncbi:MAG: hypothetical protein JXR10_03295 [Cyclobacteriaceae bacterium]